MTHSNAASISFEKTALSDEQPELTGLGELVVEELGLHNSNDTLGRWMAHRLAELIQRYDEAKTKKAKDEAASAVEDLIHRLWAHRNDRANRWPPRATTRVLDALDPPKYEKSPNTGVVWLDRFQELENLHRLEARVWIGAALIDTGVGTEKKAIEVVGDNLEFDERQHLQMLVQLHDEIRGRMRTEVASFRDLSSRKKRAENGARPLLEEINERRAELIDSVIGESGGGKQT